MKLGVCRKYFFSQWFSWFYFAHQWFYSITWKRRGLY